MVKKGIKGNWKEKIGTRGKDENCDCDCKPSKGSSCGACGGAFYGLGFIGALIYYIQTASGFWIGVLGVLKALVWPAFLVYELLKFLGM
jgi:hypothetical protein